MINDARDGQSSCAGTTEQQSAGGWGVMVVVVVVVVVVLSCYKRLMPLSTLSTMRD